MGTAPQHGASRLNEATSMRTIPSMYFRPPSPSGISKASMSYPALGVPYPTHIQTQSVRSAASSAAYRRVEIDARAEVKVRNAPAMTKRTSSSSSSSDDVQSTRSVPPEAYRRAGEKAKMESKVASAPAMKRHTTSSSSSDSSGMHSMGGSAFRSKDNRGKSGFSTEDRPQLARSHRKSSSLGFLPRRTPRVSEASIPMASIPHLREAISSLESQMANLMNERRVLESKLEQAVRQQSPVHKLPREILGSIFEIGVHHMEEEDTVLLSTLMLVCKEWTEAALNTPVIWSRIIIENNRSIAKARRKLARSKAFPLDIIILINPQTDVIQSVTEVIVHAIDILRPALWRWRSFRLAVPSQAHAHTALVQCREPAPLLEVLEIQVHQVLQGSHDVVDDTLTHLPLFAGYIPRLRTFTCTSFHFGWDVGFVKGLRVLKLGGFWNNYAPDIGTLISMLRACPGLEELAIRNMTEVDLCTDNDTKKEQECLVGGMDLLELPRLRNVSFYFAGSERVQAIMSRVAFPALESIEFSYMGDITRIIKYLRRQSRISLPLVHLRVESSSFSEWKFLRFLRQLPKLRKLELVDLEDLSSEFLEGLSPSRNEWICPDLQTLNLDGCTGITWDSFRELVESRLPPNLTMRPVNPTGSSFVNIRSDFISSASAYAAVKGQNNVPSVNSRMSRASTAATNLSRNPASSPVCRLQVIDLTRCHQFNKEMIQWLRMYVSEVRCETVKTYWGESGFTT